MHSGAALAGHNDVPTISQRGEHALDSGRAFREAHACLNLTPGRAGMVVQVLQDFVFSSHKLRIYGSNIQKIQLIISNLEPYL